MDLERWKTISRRDPDFLAHLDGSFSQAFLALPVRSLNVDTFSEEVTFEIVPAGEIRSPSPLKIAWTLARPQSLALSIGPMIATCLMALAQGLHVHAWIALSSFFGVLFFHIAVNLFNDYGDHIRGRDRLRVRGGSRVIQNGWVRALNVKRAAWSLMAAAFLCSLPAIFLHLAPVVIVGGLAALAGLEFAFQKLRLKYRGWAEIMAFILTGPALTSGFAWAVTGSIELAYASLGCVFGSLALLYFHSANFENIMVDSQAGVRTWATRAGFDASKRFFLFAALLTFASALAFVLGFVPDVSMLPAILALGISLYTISSRVRNLASPLSSNLGTLRFEVIGLCWLTTAVFAGGFIAMLLKGV